MRNCFNKTSHSPLRALSILCATLAIGFAANSARATSATWNALPTDANWEATGSENNWNTGAGTYPGGTSTSSSDTATFNNSSSYTTVNLFGATGWNIKNITFDTASCAAYTLNNNNAGTARITGGGTWQLTSTVTQPQVIQGSQLRLHTTGAVNLVNNAASPTATFTISAGVKANNSTDTLLTDQAVNLQGSNTGANTVSGAIVDYDSTMQYVSAITKSGAGTWMLTANNTYKGPTIITGGTLILSGSGAINNSTNIIINGSGATLQFNNAMNLTLVNNYMYVTNSAALVITNTTFQTPVTVANLVASNATLHVGINGTTPFTNIVVTASGGLTAGAGANTVTISIDQVAGVTTATTFDLISYVGSDPSAGNFSVSVPSGYVAGAVTVDTVNRLVTVQVTPASATPSLVWVGATSDSTQDGNWNTSDLNWLNGVTYSVYADPDLVRFDDSATGTTNVNLVGTLMPGSITVSNTAGYPTANYTFVGSGSVNAGALLKQGSGTLLIDNSTANGFSSVNIASDGVVQVGNNDANGSLGSGSITDNGSLIFNRTADLTVGGAISGSGNVSQTGTDTILLNGANSYGGTTLISGGAIKVNNFSALGAQPGGAVTINGGGTLDLGGITTANVAGGFGAKQFNVAGAGAGGNGVIINSANNVAQQNAFQKITMTADTTFGGSSRWDLRGGTPGPTLDLAGFTLTKNNANQISMVSVSVTSGNIDVKQGLLSFESSSAVNGTGTITVESGAYLGHYRLVGGAITRPITLAGGSLTNLSTSGGGSTNDAAITLTANSTVLHNTGSELYLNGVISSSGAFGLTKLGTGRTLLSAADTYSGNTIISAGTLALTNGGSINNSPKIDIAGGATFDVSGVTSSPYSLGSGQTLQGLAGTGTINGALNLSSTAGLTVSYASGTPTLTVANGALTLNNNAVTVTVSGSALTAGGYKLISAGTAGSVAGSVASLSLTVGGAGVAPGQHKSLGIIGSELYLLVTNQAPVIANIVTNSVTSGTTWKIAIADLKTAAGWSDPDGDTVTLSSVTSPSANGTNATSDGTFIYYNGSVTAEDSFTYTVSDGTLTANGTVYVEAVASTAPSISNPSLDVNEHPTFSGHGIPGVTYGVESSTVSVSGPWVNAGPDEASSTVTAGSDGAWNFTDANQSNPPLIFYRLYYPYSATPPQ